MSTRPHALVLPFPPSGHTGPLLLLSQKLAASHGFLITFVNTEHNHASFVQAERKKRHCAAESPVDESGSNLIRMVGLSDGLPPDTNRSGIAYVQQLMQSMPLHMKPLLEQLICDINQSSTPITCIIGDIFMPWVHLAAKAARVPIVLGFHVSSIADFSLIFHIPLLISSGQLNPDGAPKGSRKKVTGIPGLSDIAVANLPWVMGPGRMDKGLLEYLLSVQAHVGQCAAVLFNSYDELEKEALKALEAETQVKMVPVGPLLPCSESDLESSSHSGLSVEEKVCLDWLEGKPKSSVLYIAFGTTAWLSEREMHALALGLEASQVSFVWVVRADLVHTTAATDYLPEGFVERTKERAFFTSWAPQRMVLSHPSTGAFLTHGGWNSTMEAITNGVPMLTWPFTFDQKGNCELIVDKWKVGLPLKKAGQELAINEKEVENLVRRVMSETDEGGGMRERVGVLKSKARLAVAKPRGASYNNLHNIIQYVDARYHNSLRAD